MRIEDEEGAVRPLFLVFAASSTSRGSTTLAMQRQLAGEEIKALRLPEIAPQVPAEVVAVVSAMLEPDPNRRPFALWYTGAMCAERKRDGAYRLLRQAEIQPEAR